MEEIQRKNFSMRYTKNMKLLRLLIQSIIFVDVNMCNDLTLFLYFFPLFVVVVAIPISSNFSAENLLKT